MKTTKTIQKIIKKNKYYISDHIQNVETQETKEKNNFENAVTFITALIFGSVLINGLYLAITNLI